MLTLCYIDKVTQVYKGRQLHITPTCPFGVTVAGQYMTSLAASYRSTPPARVTAAAAAGWECVWIWVLLEES
ncbi:hypothetical protein E2C01_009953 [Portunus trituberculatus]|uniref:Uncharacterized protein n=1 Tax=Portunus trituberculatus TaxID=210409 RepID=A0A5B7D7D1_PORTR|nr:hypothetical protein [Portunus trituberculatus]